MWSAFCFSPFPSHPLSFHAQTLNFSIWKFYVTLAVFKVKVKGNEIDGNPIFLEFNFVFWIVKNVPNHLMSIAFYLSRVWIFSRFKILRRRINSFCNFRVTEMRLEITVSHDCNYIIRALCVWVREYFFFT